MHFKKKNSEGRRKPNKIWVDQGSEFYNESFKDFFKINNIEMKPIEVADDSFAEYNEESNKKIPNLKLVIMLEFLIAKIFLLKDILLIGQKKFL